MASLLQFSCFLCLLCLFISSTASNQQPQPYIVYMGSSSKGSNGGTDEGAQFSHLQLLSSIIPSQESERISILHSYSHAFKGFSAMLTEKEASILAGRDETLSVFPDPVLELHTTRSWDFLGIEAGIGSSHPSHQASRDVIIGVIDTGVWPESPSFNDHGIGEIPSRWKGECTEGPDFKKSRCNRKLIGARYYKAPQLTKQTASPRDSVGHGTHCASIAAGAPVANASFYGLARGTAKGGMFSTRIAVYKACSTDGCSGAAILKAIDDAIMDGVDILSISIGMSSVFESDFLNDPIAIGAFHAEQMGVMVICSAGNDGPYPSTVGNTAPWIFTVSASSIDRDFASTVFLGNGKSFRGFAINFSNVTRTKTYPLGFGESVASNFTAASDARNCNPGSLDTKKVAGKIIVCIDTDLATPTRIKKSVVEDAKAKGLILISAVNRGVPFDSGFFPFTQVGDVAGYQILKYIKSSKKPTATILPTVEIRRTKPAPAVAYFSSRGPGGLTENILKPDIMAPGVAILAAVIPKGEYSIPIGWKPSSFGIKSGTSMACPHVSGAASLIKSVHHQWSSSMIRSALMTTATMSNNMGKPLTNSSNYLANPHEMGVGEINPVKALYPGLVFETQREDYLYFLCYFGYSQKNIRSMSNTKFICPKNSVEDLISNINYPSISIATLNRRKGAKTVKRTVTNVGSPNATYTSSVQAPRGLVVKVSPKKIVFTKASTRASFKVSFYAQEAPRGYNFGFITWFDGIHMVRSVFAVNVE